MSISAIESVLQQMRATALQSGIAPRPAAAEPAAQGGFAAELRRSLEGISTAQNKAYGQASQSKDPLALKIVRWLDYVRNATGGKFGDIAGFPKEFSKAAEGLFGSGWTWLVLDGDKLKITTTPNGETPMLNKQHALLTLDVWEHAYYVDYRNERPKFITAFLDSLINWDFVAKRLQDETPEMMQRVIQQSVAMSRDMMPGLCARVKLRLQQEHLEESETFKCPAVWS